MTTWQQHGETSTEASGTSTTAEAALRTVARDYDRVAQYGTGVGALLGEGTFGLLAVGTSWTAALQVVAGS